MNEHDSNQQRILAPEFPAGGWLNTDQPLRSRALRGRVALVNIWDYTCINCLRTLPYIDVWHERYQPHGLTVVGVHTPVFTFGRERNQVELAARELGIRYPVLLDNDFKIWTALDNQVWPARYLIDQHGYIRHYDYGEGRYEAFERALQALLREVDNDVALPPLMLPLREEDRSGMEYQRPTPELRGGLASGALGNPEGYGGRLPMLYRLPSQRVDGAFYVAGAWQAGEDYLAYQGQTEGIIQFAYEATEVNAVLSPHHDTVERFLHPDDAVSIEVWQDDRPLDEIRRGQDATEDGRVIIHRPRMYNLVRNPEFERHELTLRVRARGLALYTFSFTGGVL
jgi:thiol-disulfide isomerase/thioredoxin